MNISKSQPSGAPQPIGSDAVKAAHDKLSQYTKNPKVQYKDNIAELLDSVYGLLKNSFVNSPDEIDAHIKALKGLKQDAIKLLGKLNAQTKKTDYQFLKALNPEKHAKYEKNAQDAGAKLLQKIEGDLENYTVCAESYEKLLLLGAIVIKKDNYKDIQNKCLELIHNIEKVDPALAKSMETDKDLKLLNKSLEKFHFAATTLDITVIDDFKTQKGIKLGKKKAHFNIPNEISTEILGFLTEGELSKLERVSKKSTEIARNISLPGYKWAFTSPMIREIEGSKAEEDRLITYPEGSKTGIPISGKEEAIFKTYIQRKFWPLELSLDNPIEAEMVKQWSLAESKGNKEAKNALSSKLYSLQIVLTRIAADRGSEDAVTALINIFKNDLSTLQPLLSSSGKLQMFWPYLDRGSKVACEFFNKKFNAQYGLVGQVFGNDDMEPLVAKMAKRMIELGYYTVFPRLIESYDKGRYGLKPEDPKVQAEALALLNMMIQKNDNELAISTLLRAHKDGLFGLLPNDKDAIDTAKKLHAMGHSEAIKLLLKLYKDHPQERDIIMELVDEYADARNILFENYRGRSGDLEADVKALAYKGDPNAGYELLRQAIDADRFIYAFELAELGHESAIELMLSPNTLSGLNFLRPKGSVDPIFEKNIHKIRQLTQKYDLPVDKKGFYSITSDKQRVIMRRMAEEYRDKGSKYAEKFLNEIFPKWK